MTQYIDRNISRLTPVAYYNYIQSMAMRAMRRKVASLIVNGDGQSTPDMFGIIARKIQSHHCWRRPTRRPNS